MPYVLALRHRREALDLDRDDGLGMYRHPRGPPAHRACAAARARSTRAAGCRALVAAAPAWRAACWRTWSRPRATSSVAASGVERSRARP